MPLLTHVVPDDTLREWIGSVAPAAISTGTVTAEKSAKPRAAKPGRGGERAYR
jgi:hypothetical protein